MNYHDVDLLHQLQILLLQEPGPNSNPRWTYIWDTPSSQKWTQIKREFSTNHLGRRKSCLPRHDPHTQRVSPHCDHWYIHLATKSGRPCPKPVRHGHPNKNSRKHTPFNKKLYLETLLFEQTFIQQIIEAIDKKYPAALRNPIIRQITPLVLAILEFLQNNYGRITPQQLDDKTTTVKSMIYDPAQPIDIIFNAINDLVEYARAAKSELTQNQTINLTPVILSRQRIFKDNIWAWKRTKQAYKTRDNFKHDFYEAHLELR